MAEHRKDFRGRFRIGVLISLFLLLVFSMVVIEQRERSSIQADNLEKQTADFAANTLEILRSSADPVLQLEEKLIRFCDDAAGSWRKTATASRPIWAENMKSLYRRSLRHWLPNHSMTWFSCVASGTKVNFAAWPLAEKGFHVPQERLAEFAEMIMLRREPADPNFAKMRTELSSLLDFPALERQDSDNNGTLRVYSSFQGL